MFSLIFMYTNLQIESTIKNKKEMVKLSYRNVINYIIVYIYTYFFAYKKVKNDRTAKNLNE